jgi:hypothetical protein
MSTIQAVLFNKRYWNIISSHMWLIRHGIYPIKCPHVTNKYIRYRIKNPRYFSRLRIIRIHKHINIIIGIR